MTGSAIENNTKVSFDRDANAKMIALWEKIRLSTGKNESRANDFIKDSWQRSCDYTIDQNKPHNDKLLNNKQLKQLRKKNRKLIDAALPAMQDLYEVTNDSDFCITLADRHGVLLERIGSKTAKKFTAPGNFIEGADWSEKVMGTNAVGIVLEIGRPVHIFGYEHYCKCACLCTCSASPIYDENQQIIGVINLTGAYNLVNPHTLAVVQSTSKSIERKFKLIDVYQKTEKSNLLRKAILESISGYLLVIGKNGFILESNEEARHLMGIHSGNSFDFKSFIEKKNPHLKQFLTAENPVYGETINFLTPKNSKIKFIMNLTPLKKGKDYKIDGIVIYLSETSKVVRNIIKSKSNIIFENLIGKSNSFKHAINQAKLSAQSESNVLLLGESGVGKDLFAQAIHNAGPRKKQTFFAINCAAVPRELLASELFGYEEGAFTGARKNGNPGKFELADKGTIFLDEIGASPLDFQAYLLRVLEENTVVRLGGNQAIPFDVRIISATNKDIFNEIKNNTFRHDLFYRIGVISIHIPPLRERKDDIPLLSEYLIKNISKRFGKKINEIDPKVMDVWMDYNWPGNVRELSNIIERGISMSKNSVFTFDLLPFEFQKTIENIEMKGTPSKAKVEAELIQKYLFRFKNNKSKTAKALEISRSSLYRKIKQYDITA